MIRGPFPFSCDDNAYMLLTLNTIRFTRDKDIFAYVNVLIHAMFHFAIDVKNQSMRSRPLVRFGDVMRFLDHTTSRTTKSEGATPPTAGSKKT